MGTEIIMKHNLKLLKSGDFITAAVGDDYYKYEIKRITAKSVYLHRWKYQKRYKMNKKKFMQELDKKTTWAHNHHVYWMMEV